jgi:hypothetical protein
MEQGAAGESDFAFSRCVIVWGFREFKFAPTGVTATLALYFGWRVPVHCGVDMNVFLLFRYEGCVERAQGYRNPVGKVALSP